MQQMKRPVLPPKPQHFQPAQHWKKMFFCFFFNLVNLMSRHHRQQTKQNKSKIHKVVLSYGFYLTLTFSAYIFFLNGKIFVQLYSSTVNSTF